MAKVDFDTAKLKNTISGKASMIVRKIVLDGMRQLIRQSPIDTGRFRANWSTSINAMSEGTTESTISNIQKSTQGIQGYKLGQTAFLHNNLEYAVPLEYGSSKQAPKGWIRNTAKEMQKKFNEIKDIV